MVAPARLSRLTVQEAVTEYLKTLERAVAGGTMSTTTQVTYQRDMAVFQRLAGPNTILDDITADDIDDLITHYGAEPDARYTRSMKPGKHAGRGPGSQARLRASVSRLFTIATRRGWVQQNPMPDTAVKPRTQTLRASVSRTALPHSSAVALLAVPKNRLDAPRGQARKPRKDQQTTARDTAILRLLLEVGPRVSELCAAVRTDLSVDDAGVTWWHIPHGKGDKPRSVPLSPATAEAVRTSLAEKRPAPLIPADTAPKDRRVLEEAAAAALFVTYRGKPITPRDVQNLVHRLTSALPIEVRRDVTPHGLRHTAATLLLASGAADVRTVQAVLGHASLATTGIYLDEVSEVMVRAVAAHPVTAGTNES